MEVYTTYRPQSSGKVEHMNRTLKATLAKLCQDPVILARHVTPSLSPSLIYPEVLRLFSL